MVTCIAAPRMTLRRLFRFPGYYI